MAALVRLYRTPCSLCFRLLQKGIVNTRGKYTNIFPRGIAYSASLQKSTDSEWKDMLNSEQYWVCRQKGTEAPWSGEYIHCKAKGIYQCVCCGSALFSSSTKFDSGSGWPSFYAPLQDHPDEANEEMTECSVPVTQKEDHIHGMNRVEVLCKECDAHLGHVFKDGPPPTGLRYCINSIALKFKQADDK